MKFFSSTIIFLFIINIVFSQDLQFDDKGRLLNIDEFKAVKNSYALSRTSHNYLTPELKLEIKKSLAAKLQIALNNIQDIDLLTARKLYDTLWGPDVVNLIIAEITDLRNYLLGHNISRANWKYVPPPNSVEAAISQDIFSFTSCTLDNNNKTCSLISTNLFKSWIVQYFNASVSNYKMDDIIMDINYLKGWRELEKWYKQVNEYIVKTKNVDSIYDCKDINLDDIKKNVDFIYDGLNKNYIIKLLKGNDFFKSWLWYTYGIMQINPIGVTTPDRKYPVGEENTFDTSKGKLNDNQEADSLKKFAMTKQIQNRLTLPVFKNLIEAKQVSDIWNYDGAKDYETNSSTKSKLIEQKDGLAAVVYNIPQNGGVTISLDTATILDDRSQAIVALNGTLDQLTGLATAAPGLLTHWKGIDDLLKNVFPPTIPPLKVPKDKLDKAVSKGAGTGSPALALIGSIQDSLFSINQLYALSDLSANVKNEEENNFVNVNSRRIPITKDNNIDKRNIIVAFLRGNDEDTCSNCKAFELRASLISPFLKKDECYLLNYKEEDSIAESIKNLLPRFICFIDAVNRCRDSINSTYKALEILFKKIKLYVNITQRSLPPSNLIELRNEIPVFRSQSAKLILPDGPKILLLKIQPSIKNSVGQDSSLTLITNRFKAAPLHYLDVSIGISYLTNQYWLKQQSSDSSLPTLQQSERFKLIAGIHIYPFGLYNIDDTFLDFQQWKHRISLFAGVGIHKALENFFTGVGYDIVPGIRLVVGAHFYKDTKFKIVNNQVVDKVSGYKASGAFVSFNIEPVSFIKLLGIF